MSGWHSILLSYLLTWDPDLVCESCIYAISMIRFFLGRKEHKDSINHLLLIGFPKFCWTFHDFTLLLYQLEVRVILDGANCLVFYLPFT